MTTLDPITRDDLIVALVDRLVDERTSGLNARLAEVTAQRDRLADAMPHQYRRGYLAGYGARERGAACLPDGAKTGRPRLHAEVVA